MFPCRVHRSFVRVISRLFLSSSLSLDESSDAYLRPLIFIFIRFLSSISGVTNPSISSGIFITSGLWAFSYPVSHLSDREVCLFEVPKRKINSRPK